MNIAKKKRQKKNQTIKPTKNPTRMKDMAEVVSAVDNSKIQSFLKGIS